MKRCIIRICQLVCLLTVIMGSGLGVMYLMQQSSIVNAQKTASPTNISAASTMNPTNAELKAAFESYIAAHPELTVGVSVINLENGAQTDTGESAAFLGASTTKVLTAAYYMQQVEQGKTSLATVIQGATAENLIQRMLQNSDNDAWTALNEYVGKSNLQTYAHSIGLSSYDASNNTITAHDQAQLLARLYRYRLANASHTQLILSSMQNTNNDTLIPAAVSASASVYHKYGQLDGELHDSAIVADGKHAYVLVIFTKADTSTVEDITTRTQLFHDLTKSTTAVLAS